MENFGCTDMKELENNLHLFFGRIHQVGDGLLLCFAAPVDKMCLKI